MIKLIGWTHFSFVPILALLAFFRLFYLKTNDNAAYMNCNTKKYCVLQKKVLSFGPNHTVRVQTNISAKPNIRSVTNAPSPGTSGKPKIKQTKKTKLFSIYGRNSIIPWFFCIFTPFEESRLNFEFLILIFVLLKKDFFLTWKM